MNSSKLAKMIDHTNLKPDATLEDMEMLCNEAKYHGFASVCVNPANIKSCKELLENSDVKVCAVIGFPLGANTSKIKFFETRDAIALGASEIDVVMNIGTLKSGFEDAVKEDIKGVVDAAEENIVKVIIETTLLTEKEKVKAYKIAKKAGAGFVKTSTGFGCPGATREDIVLIRKTVGAKMGVKASGGIKNLKTALEMIEAGATRIGTSSGLQIMEEFLRKY